MIGMIFLLQNAACSQVPAASALPSLVFPAGDEYEVPDRLRLSRTASGSEFADLMRGGAFAPVPPQRRIIARKPWFDQEDDLFAEIEYIKGKLETQHLRDTPTGVEQISPFPTVVTELCEAPGTCQSVMADTEAPGPCQSESAAAEPTGHTVTCQTLMADGEPSEAPVTFQTLVAQVQATVEAQERKKVRKGTESIELPADRRRRSRK